MINVKVTSSITKKRSQHGMTELFLTEVRVKSTCFAGKHNSEWFTTLAYSVPVLDRRAKQKELVDELKRLSKSFKVGKITHVTKGEAYGISGVNRIKRNREILKDFATRFKLGSIE